MIPPTDTQLRQYAEAVADCLSFDNDETRNEFIRRLMIFQQAGALRVVGDVNVSRMAKEGSGV